MAVEASRDQHMSENECQRARQTAVLRHNYIKVIEFDEHAIAGGMASGEKRAFRSTAKASCGGGKAVDVTQSQGGGIMAYCEPCGTAVFWNSRLKEWCLG